ncbi:hypothetical protein LAZ40_05680 [Cereibacter sphaeroides]|uniref:hypothetical protein n=1 Tax=Cereibacter sphaeroides TaxID=1063 RepID=UPI001F278F26|nr:hypothetical protein [Cereibacter sphaeroides]MCE6958540.1 hypothetical protein [Cereibacter sphaeroides]MCE6972797.1 hypothetical protein [Cereibacter sphaeroides]
MITNEVAVGMSSAEIYLENETGKLTDRDRLLGHCGARQERTSAGQPEAWLSDCADGEGTGRSRRVHAALALVHGQQQDEPRADDRTGRHDTLTES